MKNNLSMRRDKYRSLLSLEDIKDLEDLSRRIRNPIDSIILIYGTPDISSESAHRSIQ